MSAQPVSARAFRSVNAESSAASSQSFWNRFSNWASEHKAIVYTIAGAAVVITGAGLVYYLKDSSQEQISNERRASKKERRRAKKEKEAAERRVFGRLCDATYITRFSPELQKWKT